MGTTIFIFCTLLIGGNILSVCGTVYSNPDTVLRFSQCLIQKMGESQIFTTEDRNNMVEVANVMSEALLSQQTKLPPRILLTAFITSMADVISHEDAVINADRKVFYTTTLEQCSLSTTGYTDNEFIDVALGILSSVEAMKLSTFQEAGSLQNSKIEVPGAYNRNSNPEGPSAFNPLSVQPSPVQNPHISGNFNPNDKTNFEPAPDFRPVATNTNPLFQVQLASNAGFFSGNEASRISQQEPAIVASEFLQESGSGSISKTSGIASSFGSMNSPQTKESSVFAIPPAASKQPAENYPLPQQAMGEIIMQPLNMGRVPQRGMDAMILSSPFPQANVQNQDSKFLQDSGPAANSETSGIASSFGGLNIPQTKESSVVVIPPAASKQPAENYPMPQLPMGEVIMQPTGIDRVSLPEKGKGAVILSSSFPRGNVQNQNSPFSYRLEDIILNALAESLTFRNTFNFNTPPEAAINLASSITSKSLEGYNLDVVSEASNAVSDEIAKVSFHTPENYALAISNAIVYVLKLHNLLLFTNGSKIAASFLYNLENTKEFSPQAETFKDPSSDIVYPTWNEKQADFDFDSPPLAPEDTGGAIFSKVLAQYLSESSELSNFFCDTDISESKMKIYFTIIKSSLAGFGHHVPPITASIASGALLELSKQELCSRYAKTISDVIAETLEVNGILQGADAESIAKKMEFSLIQLNVSPEPQTIENTTINPPHKEIVNGITTLPPSQSSFSSNFDNINATSSSFNQASVEYVTYEDKNFPTSYYLPSEQYDGAVSHTFSAPPSPIQTSSNSDINSYTTPITTPYTAEITDEEFTSATTLIKVISNTTEISPDKSSLDWAPGGVIDQEELASYLLEELETILETYYNNDSDVIDINSSPDGVTTPDEVAKGSSQSDALISSFQSERKIQNDNTAPFVRDGNRNYSQGGKMVPPDYVSEHHVPAETESNDNRNVNQKEASTKGSSVKKDLVELQPSFQEPQSSEYPTRSVLSPNFGYDVISDDLSITAARAISQIATSSIAYIRSGNFDINILCFKINELAPIANIPPLDYCGEISAIDYLLNVLNSIAKKIKNV